jgi:hypothetical protein
MGTIHWAACRAPGEGSYSWTQTDPPETLRPKGVTVHVGHTQAPIWGVKGAIYRDDPLLGGPGRGDRGMLPDPAWFDWDADSILAQS